MANFVKAQLKNDLYIAEAKMTASAYVASKLPAIAGSFPLCTSLPPAATLVPMPRSTPLTPDALWPAERIATAMRAVGIGLQVAPLLERATAVQKSSRGYSAADRPTPEQHYESLRVKRLLAGEPPSIIVVDDVITRGSTLLGAAARLNEAFPGVEVVGFAAVRTYSDWDGVTSPQLPVAGVVSYQNGVLRRKP